MGVFLSKKKKYNDDVSYNEDITGCVTISPQKCINMSLINEIFYNKSSNGTVRINGFLSHDNAAIYLKIYPSENTITHGNSPETETTISSLIKEKFSNKYDTQLITYDRLYSNEGYCILTMPSYKYDLYHLAKEKKCKQHIGSLVLDIITGLKNLHSIGYVHHDLSPENILIYDDKNGTPRCIICDYGLSKPIGTPLTREFGKSSYVCRELWKLNERSTDYRKNKKKTIYSSPCMDTYSLGHIIYIIITGTLLYVEINDIYYKNLKQGMNKFILDKFWKEIIYSTMDVNPLKRPDLDALYCKIKQKINETKNSELD